MNYLREIRGPRPWHISHQYVRSRTPEPVCSEAYLYILLPTWNQVRSNARNPLMEQLGEYTEE